MNEYIVFDPTLRDRFLDFLAARGLPCGVHADSIAGFVVRLSADLTDQLDDEIEAEYEALMAAQRELSEAESTAARSQMMVTVDLADGRPHKVLLPALYARRLYEHFTIDEIRDLVAAIAQSAIDPLVESACSRS